MEKDMPIFPQEIITSILVRLPVKSLIRFQCVCKSWKNLFRTPSFIAEHLHHSTRQNPLLIVDSDVSGCIPWRLCLLNCEMEVSEFENTHIIDSLMSGCFYCCNHMLCKMSGWLYSSNGLLCVKFSRNSQDHLWLWNPSIRVVRQVPESLNEPKYFSVGFGFSPIIDDYKIVKFFLAGFSVVVQAEVYSLRTGLWRKVEVGNLEGVYDLGCGAFSWNGAIFWIGEKKDVEVHNKSHLELIVSFDIAGEVFTLIPFPTLNSADSCYKRLASFENKLALLFTSDIENSGSWAIDLWVLEECTDPSRERWSWAKIYTSTPNPCWICAEIIWRNEIVCLVEAFEGEEGKVVLCNLTTNEFKPFGCSSRPGILEYVESLVLLDNIHV
ncbi:hypothetical protein QN277_009193 [Acacia crassicarpa]|uniref:F-box domain-containing protein n=1 Tax=Acacia crassicarpa TaxID=499986 RepID=A0AAE1JRH7_9FABA|nr:hypothetical protein QN277_009193 [Acacia crassicarpa]